MSEGTRPDEEYERRLKGRRQELAANEAADARVAWGRLALALAAVVIAWLAFGPGVVSAAWLWLPIFGFVALLIVHERLRRRRDAAGTIATYLERRLARIRGGWQGEGPDGARFADPAHPYAGDLDLFGRGSLFQLLSVASTPGGEARLAAWLLDPAEPSEILRRQEAVRELASDLDLREDLAPAGKEWSSRGEGSLLMDWAAATPVQYRLGERILTSLAAAAATLTLIGWLIGWGPTPFFIAILVAIAVAGSLRKRMASTLGGVVDAGRELETLEKVLMRVERQEYRSPLLRDLLHTDERRPSAAVASLRRLTDLFDASRNQFFAPIGALILWNQHLAFVFENWRRRHGADLAQWIEAVATFEALQSLAAHAWEHPGDVFPELVTEPRLELEGVAHPLLVESVAVRNDVVFDPETPLYIVSGSNMSGKSTLMRSVGTNVVLAQCGGVVRAARMVLSPVAIGASIRLNDSLEEGASRFYAEIRRLRQIVDLAGGERTLLALLDEVLAGTNSHDRRIGAQAIVRKLVSNAAFGLVTTHDLALTKLADDDSRIVNIHFEDRMEGDRMEFDYRLKPGVVTRSNAIALMRAVGLEV